MTKKKKRIFISIIVISIFAGIAFFMNRNTETLPEFSSVVVERQELKQSVEETGTVVSELDIRYGWETSGRVVSIEKSIGDSVLQGELIASLESSRQSLQLAEARARFASANAALELQLAGATNEQIARSEAAIDQAQAAVDQKIVDVERIKSVNKGAIIAAELALKDAQSSEVNQGSTTNQAIEDVYEDAVQQVNSVVLSSLTAMATLSNIQHGYAELMNTSLESLVIRSQKAVAVELLVGSLNAGSWRASDILNQQGGLRGEVRDILEISERPQQRIESAVDQAQILITEMKKSIESMIVGVNTISGVSATEKTALDTQKSAMDTALASIINTRQAIATAKLSKQTSTDTKEILVQKAQQQLEDIKQKAIQDLAIAEAGLQVSRASLRQSEASHAELLAPPRTVDLASLRASVAQQSASVSQFVKEYEKTQLRALASGIISDLSVDVGETVNANQEVLGIISEGLSIDVDISESEIAKIAIGDRVRFTLDAFGDDEEFMGSVARIDPAQTEISGVVYYNTDIVIDEFTSSTGSTVEIRPGMTVNLEIDTDSADGALVIPERAIIEKNGLKLVRVLTNKETAEYVEREVKIGIPGNSGNIEIISGLAEGEEIITFIDQSTK